MAACCTPVDAKVHEETRKRPSSHTQRVPLSRTDQPSIRRTAWDGPAKITQRVVTQGCHGPGFALQCFLSTFVRALTSDAFLRSVLLANRETAPPAANP